MAIQAFTIKSFICFYDTAQDRIPVTLDCW